MTGDFILGLTIGFGAGLVAAFVVVLFQTNRSTQDDNFRGDQWP